MGQGDQSSARDAERAELPCLQVTDKLHYSRRGRRLRAAMSTDHQQTTLQWARERARAIGELSCLCIVMNTLLTLAPQCSAFT